MSKEGGQDGIVKTGCIEEPASKQKPDHPMKIGGTKITTRSTV